MNIKEEKFEKYLERICFEENTMVLDDDYPDFFENWLEQQDIEEMIKHGDNYAISQKAEIIKEIEGMKKYHKKFECNGAHGGKGCYETWCEDQNCRNAPKEYNQALDDILNQLKDKEK